MASSGQNGHPLVATKIAASAAAISSKTVATAIIAAGSASTRSIVELHTMSHPECTCTEEVPVFGRDLRSELHPAGSATNLEQGT
jgi:hypothetical protein